MLSTPRFGLNHFSTPSYVFSSIHPHKPSSGQQESWPESPSASTRNQQTSNGKKEMRKACKRGIKQISMTDMASKETRK